MYRSSFNPFVFDFNYEMSVNIILIVFYRANYLNLENNNFSYETSNEFQKRFLGNCKVIGPKF